MSLENSNTLDKYKTTLGIPLNLESHKHWEIGLVNITYPSSWVNISENEISMSLSKNGNFIGRFTIPPGIYTWDFLLLKIKDMSQPDIMQWSTIRNNDKVFYFMKQCDVGETYTYNFSPGAAKLLTGGVLSFSIIPELNYYEEESRYVTVDIPKKDIEWDSLPEVDKKMTVYYNSHAQRYYFLFYGERNFKNSAANQMFQVKCDLVNSHDQVIRSLVPKTDLDFNQHDFYQTEYHDIQNYSKIYDITMEIVNRDGQPVRFQSGKVIMVLNLRPKIL